MDSVKSYAPQRNPLKVGAVMMVVIQERSLIFKIQQCSHLPDLLKMLQTIMNECITTGKPITAFYRSFSNHPNGAIGINAIKLAVKDLETATIRNANMGLPEVYASEQEMAFQIKGHQKLTLSSPESKEDAIAKFIQERGSGVYAIRFDVKNIDSTYHYLNQRLSDNLIIRDSVKI